MKTEIEYIHSEHIHTLPGPRALLQVLFESHVPASILDVGCGIATWTCAAMELGVLDVFGIDGVDIPAGKILIPRTQFRRVDLTGEWEIGRKFEMALCLEVAEHLDAVHAKDLVRKLTLSADVVVFSAACPGQPGQHHVNCQWPAYWQALFNEQGFSCDDSLRWRIWDDKRIEPWYRQNIFVASKNPELAGREKNLIAVVHPETVPQMERRFRHDLAASIRSGAMPTRWYLKTPPVGLASKLARTIRAVTTGKRKIDGETSPVPL